MFKIPFSFKINGIILATSLLKIKLEIAPEIAFYE